MAVVQPNVLVGIYTYAETLAAAGNSSDIEIPRGEQDHIMITITTTGTATGYAQYTASSYASIAASTANWVKWTPGTIGAAASGFENTFRAMTGVRFVMASGAGTVIGELSF